MGKFDKPPIVLVYEAPDDLFCKQLVSEIRSLGWRLVNLDFSADYIPLDQPFAGAVLNNLPKRPVVDTLYQLKLPIIDISKRGIETLTPDYYVQSDLQSAYRLAADAFAERGFAHVAYVDFSKGTPPTFDAITFREQVEANGCVAHYLGLGTIPLDKSGNFDPDDVLKVMTEWLQSLPTPLAILAYNHKMASRIFKACLRAGLAIPEQVALACLDNREFYCEAALIPLSAVDTNTAELAKQSVLLLKRLWDGEDVQEKRILVQPKGFIERRSTDIIAVSDPRVAKALRFMWDHLSWPLRIEDIAFEVGTSHSTLNKAFRKHLGRTVNEELRRKRLEISKELLRGTDLPVSQITKEVGFTSRRYLHHAFKEAYGLTPLDYRNSHG